MKAVLAAIFILAGCASAGGGAADDNAAVYSAWSAHRSHLELTATGSVARDLGTRRGPSGNHEGFLVHLSGAGGHGLTIRVEANVDITGPIPIAEGAPVRVRGEYIYDPRGGLVHWTHRDPRMRHEAGFVEIGGHTYQ